MRAMQVLLWAIVVLLGLAAGACQQSGGRLLPVAEPADMAALQAELAQLDSLAVPAGADAKTFAMLKSQLREMLLRHRDARSASAAPGSERSVVTDLYGRSVGVSASFAWTYRNEGDYNQDGEVAIHDLTPLGMHYGKTTESGDWAAAQIADGNEDGVVNLADLVPIGINFSNRVEAYALMYSATPEHGADWSQFTLADFSSSTLAPGQRRSFTCTAVLGPAGYYRVEPRHGLDAGIPSNVARIYAAGPGDWYMLNHDRQHSGRSPLHGPQVPEVKWTYDTGAKINTSISTGADGTLYFGVTDEAELANSGLLALYEDGKLRWKYDTGVLMRSTPAVSFDGTIYVGGGTCLYAVHPFGTLKWIWDTGNSVYSSPAVSAAGLSIYVASYNGALFVFDDTGHIVWTADIGEQVLSSPALDPEFNVFIGSGDCNLYAFDSSGAELWTCFTGSDPIGLESSPLIDYNDMVYIGSWNSNLYAISYSGTQLWHFDTNGFITGTPSMDHSGRIVFGTLGSTLYAVLPDGSADWSSGTGSTIKAGVAIDADDTIYYGASDGRLVARTPDGMTKWTVELGTEHILGGPAIGKDGVILVASLDGIVYCIGELD